MVKAAPIEANLVRLRQFLKRLEADAQITLGDVDVGRHEIEMLKHEIAYLEDVLNYGSKAYLLHIPIDYGASRSAGRVGDVPRP